MPIEIGFWNITDNEVKKVNFSSIDSEKRLEDILTKDSTILGEDFLIIGRQIMTSYGKYIDLLSINQDGNLTIIELKKDKTPREIVAQTLDYASWIKDLSYSEIKNICEEYYSEGSFETIFEEKFGITPPDKLNQEHDMLIVSVKLDNETERIINYLSDSYNVPINAVFFRFFKDNKNEYLSRSWLIDPTEVVEKTSKSKSQNKSEAWNGKDFVVNIDMDERGVTTWEDSQKYGFISAGGGKWYSNSLKQLFVGARIFAMIPKKGYVGVGIVKDKSVPIKDFTIKENDEEKSILDVDLKCSAIKDNSNDLEKCEYLVRVEWIKTKPEEKAYWEKGLRANQNSAFKLRNKFTLEKLIEHFELDEE
ncbi:MAG: endonuclease NucS [Melioribacteraceae bacterium]|nr:endonuclease NucS [Melioribacteraceae bacterium]